MFALVLVLLKYNPSGESANCWISAATVESAFGPLRLLLVAPLLIGRSVFWIAPGARLVHSTSRWIPCCLAR